MPITVACPHCQARLSAPDAAAGKQVKCVKCRQLIPVPESTPGYEVVENAPPTADAPAVARRATPVEATRPKPRAAVEEDEDDDRPGRKRPRDDDEDEDDDRPRGRSRRDDDEDDDRPAKPRKKKKSSLPLIIVGAAVGVFLIAGCGLGGLYMLAKPVDDKPRFPGGGGPIAAGGGGGTEVGAGGVKWIKFQGPDFLAQFPNDFPLKKDPFAEVTDPAGRKQREAVGPLNSWARQDGGRTYAVTAYDLPAAPPAGQVEQVLGSVTEAVKTATPGETMTEVNSTGGEWKGYPFKQITLKKPTGQIVFVRAILAKATLYVLDVEGEAGMTESDPVVSGYLDGFVPQPTDVPVKKGASAPTSKGPSAGTPKKKNPKK